MRTYSVILMAVAIGCGKGAAPTAPSAVIPFPEPAPTIDELIKHVPGLPDYLATAAYQSGRASPTTVQTLVSLVQPWDGVRRFQDTLDTYSSFSIMFPADRSSVVVLCNIYNSPESLSNLVMGIRSIMLAAK